MVQTLLCQIYIFLSERKFISIFFLDSVYNDVRSEKYIDGESTRLVNGEYFWDLGNDVRSGGATKKYIDETKLQILALKISRNDDRILNFNELTYYCWDNSG